MELREKTVKVYKLELTKNDALDLKKILQNHLEENYIGLWQRCTIDKLKKILEEVK